MGARRGRQRARAALVGRGDSGVFFVDRAGGRLSFVRGGVGMEGRTLRRGPSFVGRMTTRVRGGAGK
jgi:hypothetical protein